MGKAYELSRQIFELNASRVGSVMIDPIDGVDTFDVAEVALMQMELARWQVRNFGVSSDERMALGLYSELDELNMADSHETSVDAWADAAIYAGQLLMNNRLSIAPIIMRLRSDPGESIGHVVLKCAQGIRGIAGDNYRPRLYASVHVALREAWRSIATDLTMAQAYLAVGAEVLKRDWRKFPLNGRDQ